MLTFSAMVLSHLTIGAVILVFGFFAVAFGSETSGGAGVALFFFLIFAGIGAAFYYHANSINVHRACAEYIIQETMSDFPDFDSVANKSYLGIRTVRVDDADEKHKRITIHSTDEFPTEVQFVLNDDFSYHVLKF